MSDLISRQAAIDAINHICPVDTEWDCTLLDRVDVRYVLSNLPSAQPERKKGKWIRITEGAMPELYVCPFCHRAIESYGVEELLSVRYPYCHCGADMRGEGDG